MAKRYININETETEFARSDLFLLMTSDHGNAFRSRVGKPPRIHASCALNRIQFIFSFTVFQTFNGPLYHMKYGSLWRNNALKCLKALRNKRGQGSNNLVVSMTYTSEFNTANVGHVVCLPCLIALQRLHQVRLCWEVPRMLSRKHL